MVTFRVLTLSWALAAAHVAFASVGSAAPESARSEPRPLGEALEGEAVVAYNAGKLLFEDGDFAGALAKFRYAYTLSKEPRLLWNMATCEKEQHHYANATQLIDQYLVDGAALITPARRAEVETTRDTLSTFVSPLQLTGAPPQFRLYLDGKHVEHSAAAPLKLDLGIHTLRVEAPDYEAKELRVEVPGKEPVLVQVTLKPAIRTGQLRVNTDDSAATILIDGKAVGRGSWEGPLGAGPHRVKVTAPEGTAHEEEVVVGAGASRTLTVKLEEDPAPLWPWLVGGAAILVGGGVGGYFLFRDADEPAGPGGSRNVATFDLP
jgi:PEGA domain